MCRRCHCRRKRSRQLLISSKTKLAKQIIFLTKTWDIPKSKFSLALWRLALAFYFTQTAAKFSQQPTNSLNGARTTHQELCMANGGGLLAPLSFTQASYT